MPFDYLVTLKLICFVVHSRLGDAATDNFLVGGFSSSIAARRASSGLPERLIPLGLSSQSSDGSSNQRKLAEPTVAKTFTLSSPIEVAEIGTTSFFPASIVTKFSPLPG
jgi:hypothetical protein